MDLADRGHRKFQDLTSAGYELSQSLLIDTGPQNLVLAIANAGVPVALPVAQALKATIDLIAIRRLFAAQGGELPVAAVSIAGNLVFDPVLSQASSAATTVEDQFIKDALKDLSARVNTLRDGAAPKEVARRNVILIDNGIHTAGTIQIAIKALRSLQPSKITVGVPVANARLRDIVEAIADTVCCLQWSDNFGHVGLWYQNFSRPNDAEVRAMMYGRST